MPRTAKTTAPEAARTETQTAESQNGNTSTSNGNNGNSPAVKSLVEQVDQIKDNLRNVIRDLSTIIDTVKAAEKEKRATDKEIEAVRTKLRQIQNVSI
jgi:predicted  nucleic acid-binding Zn-ribbon protein